MRNAGVRVSACTCVRVNRAPPGSGTTRARMRNLQYSSRAFERNICTVSNNRSRRGLIFEVYCTRMLTDSAKTNAQRGGLKARVRAVAKKDEQAAKEWNRSSSSRVDDARWNRSMSWVELEERRGVAQRQLCACVAASADSGPSTAR